MFVIPAGQKIPKARWIYGEATEVATNDVDEIRRRARELPFANIGIATGNGLAVLDVDPQHGGKVPSWAPETRTARTPSGGAHLYYAVTEDVPNSAGGLFTGVDVRGTNGMVLAPPSVVEGGSYEWANSLPVATIDHALLRRRLPGAPTKLKASYGEGDRHSAMLTLAGKMRSIGCELPEISAALHALNRSRFQPVLGDEWVDKVTKSIVQYAPDSDLLP